MPDSSNNNVEIEKEININIDLLKVAMDAIHQTDEMARNYANIAPILKPSWVGIFLIAISVFLEYTPVNWLSAKTDGFNSLMLIGGMVGLAIGAIAETAIHIYQIRLAQSQKAEALRLMETANKTMNSLFERLTGRSGDKRPS